MCQTDRRWFELTAKQLKILLAVRLKSILFHDTNYTRNELFSLLVTTSVSSLRVHRHLAQLRLSQRLQRHSETVRHAPTSHAAPIRRDLTLLQRTQVHIVAYLDSIPHIPFGCQLLTAAAHVVESGTENSLKTNKPLHRVSLRFIW